MVVSVILSGGAGTRLWPVSREAHPKPFMKLADGQSLLLKTYLRAANVGQGEIITVTNRDYFFRSKDELACARLGEGRSTVFLLEPLGHNTAPAVAMAALHVAEKHGRDAKLLVLAADHLIRDEKAFAKAMADAANLAEQDFLVTFGIVPNAPETGFGYVEAGEAVGVGRLVKRFVEKPPSTKHVNTLLPVTSSGMRACSVSRWRSSQPTSAGATSVRGVPSAIWPSRMPTTTVLWVK